MRWFVEVSRVGENGVADEYCVEAQQWQAALQEARKLRGDTGALSKFSIELLDRGYRAVDPSLKLRYLINEAPSDAPLTGESSKKNGSKAQPGTGKQRVAESLAPSTYATSLAPTPFTTSLAPPATSSLVPRGGSLAPRPHALVPPRAVSTDAPRPSQLVVPSDPVPPAPLLPGRSSVAPHSSAPRVPLFELVRERVEEPRPDSPITYREFAYAVEPGRTRGEIEALLYDRYLATLATIVDRPPGKFVQLAVFDHVFKRRPERPPLATFAWKDWRGEPVLAFPGFGEEPMAPMSRVPAARESVLPSLTAAAASVAPRAPSLTAPPVPSFPASPSTFAGAAAGSPSVAPNSGPVVPIVPVILASTPPAAPLAEAAPAPVAASAPPGVEAAPTPVVEAEIPTLEAAPAPVVEAEIPITEAAHAPVVEAEIPALEAAPAPAVDVEIPTVAAAPAPVVDVEIPTVAAAPQPLIEAETQFAEAASAKIVEAEVPVAQGAPFEVTFESSPMKSAPTAPAASAERASRPRIAAEGRRRAGEDLIGELFEIMHELHFEPDVAAGSEFVLSVLNELLPCEGVLIHVFDINTGHFVVVRAKGPHAASVLLQRMPDQDPLVQSVMHRTHALSVKDASQDARFAGPRWQALGVTPRSVLCGGVQLSGRYLGLLEVANPYGGVPFHQSELNALDYICEQFAAFLSKKPIVLSADVVLSRG